MIRYVVVGVVVALALFYLGVAFIVGDIAWVLGMFSTWRQGDRAAFLFGMLCFAAFGAAGGAIAKYDNA